MAPSIDLTDPTYRRLARRIRRFGETAEDVVRALLDEVEAGGERDDAREPAFDPRFGPRAAPGSILPETDYWLPILKVIEEAGGAAAANDVIAAVGERLGSRLTEVDRQTLQMGEVRWRNRARFARLRMRERGLLDPDSPRGVWKITDAGRRFLAEAEADRAGG